MTRWSRLSDAELDERLTGELREFTAGVRLPREWSRLGLLPAVRARISPRLERVRTGRLAPPTGLAAVLAVVVMVILVVPRVVPGPAASPSAVSGLDDPSPTGLLEPTTGPIVGTPQPSPASKTVDCPYAGQDAERPLEIAITDRTGLIASCAAIAPGLDRPAGPDPEANVTNPGGDTSRLDIFWTVGALCSIAPADLELMPVDDGYLVVVDKLSAEGRPVACRPAFGNQGVTLELSAPIPAESVEGLVLHAGRGSAIAETSGGSFYLTIGAGRREYSPTDNIDVDAEFSYSDGPDTIQLAGSTSGLIGFGVEQLDGGFEASPVRRLDCTAYDAAYSHPLRVPFQKSGRDPNDGSFWSDYLRDPDLRLPPGIWRVYAIANFTLGECGGEEVALSASTIIRTTAGPIHSASPAPPPTAVPTQTSPPTAATRTLQCPYETGEDRPLEVEIVDHSGLVIGCGAFVEPSTPEIFVQATNVGPDQTMLEVRWEIPEVCSSMPVRIGLWGPLTYEPPFGLPPPFVLQIDHAADPESDQGCSDSVATQGVRLALRSTISAEDVEAFRTSDGRGFAVSRFGDHSLTLTLAADKLEYAAGEPIDAEATLLYSGPRHTVRLVAGDPNPGFGFHQLDGPLRQMVGSDLMTEAVELERDVPLVIRYRKSGPYITNRPEGPFSEEAYWADPELRLPPGLYRIYAAGGGDLDGNFWDRDSRIVYARASIVIHVR